MDDLTLAWMERPLWPWPFAVAHIAKVAPEVLDEVVRALVYLPTEGGLVSLFTAPAALGLITTALGGESFYERDKMLEIIERDVVLQLERGQLEAWGSQTEGSKLEPIPPTAWVGGELYHHETSDLTRRHSDGDRSTWYSNLHILAASIKSHVPSQPADRGEKDEEQLEKWAADAAQRKVAVRDAGADAQRVLGSAAPPELTCRDRLKAAKNRLGEPVVRGRPRGAKSFRKQRVKK